MLVLKQYFIFVKICFGGANGGGVEAWTRPVLMATFELTGSNDACGGRLREIEEVGHTGGRRSGVGATMA